VLALLAVAFYRNAKRHRIALWRIALVAILLIVITAAANPSLIQKFADRGERNPYNYERVQIWMKSLSMIASYPALGVGVGRFMYISKLFTPAVDGTIGRYQKWANIAHSEYLQYTAELGIPIAMLMLLIGGYLFSLAWKRANSISSDSRIAQEAALLVAVGLGTHALVDNNWTVPVMAAGLAANLSFNPLDAVGWHGDLCPVRLNVRDIRPLMSHRFHLPPSAHTTFVGRNFVVCTFVPRPIESDPGALKVPFYHNNDDYDEVIFYHRGDFFSRDNIKPGMVTFHPCGFTHGPHPKAFQAGAAHARKETDEYAVMIDARYPLTVAPLPEGVENRDYVYSWKPKRA